MDRSDSAERPSSRVWGTRRRLADTHANAASAVCSQTIVDGGGGRAEGGETREEHTRGAVTLPEGSGGRQGHRPRMCGFVGAPRAATRCAHSRTPTARLAMCSALAALSFGCAGGQTGQPDSETNWSHSGAPNVDTCPLDGTYHVDVVHAAEGGCDATPKQLTVTVSLDASTPCEPNEIPAGASITLPDGTVPATGCIDETHRLVVTQGNALVGAGFRLWPCTKRATRFTSNSWCSVDVCCPGGTGAGDADDD